MKARITHLKAPWPSGAVVGAVVMFASGAVPAWAVGKCEPAGVDETPTHVVPDGGETQSPSGDAAVDKVREEARQHIERLEAQFQQHAQDLQAKLQDLSGQNEALQTAKAEAESKVTGLQAALAAAEEGKAAAVKAADDLQAKLAAATAKKK
jgi:hypothetical protein